MRPAVFLEIRHNPGINRLHIRSIPRSESHTPNSLVDRHAATAAPHRYYERMSDERSPISAPLPPHAAPALRIIETLTTAGHVALLNGGCVRDLLLGNEPGDYDVATDATPDRVCQLFKPTRKVGAHFGVVLVRSDGDWIEVATFRADGQYLDGRRPSSVTFGDARLDAQRRDFTVNGMFLDPQRHELIDYVGGRIDLAARQIRAIGEPAARFTEDHLRLLRAVRFAARLEFALEIKTAEAIRQHAAELRSVAPERVLQELEKMLAHRTRARAFELLCETGLLPFLWQGASWTPEQQAAAHDGLKRLGPDATFAAALAVLLADRPARAADEACRKLTCSNEQRDTTTYLIAHQADLDDPKQPGLAEFKRLLAHPAFGELRLLAESRYRAMPDGDRRAAALQHRIAAIPPESIQPAPFITGDDLAARRVPPGPRYKQVLDALYTRQLNEELADRAAALAELERLLQEP